LTEYHNVDGGNVNDQEEVEAEAVMLVKEGDLQREEARHE
jgi:hypothetical protein